MVRHWQDKRRFLLLICKNVTSVFIHFAVISLRELLYSCENLENFVQSNLTNVHDSIPMKCILISF